jgi:hypothetical protein
MEVIRTAPTEQAADGRYEMIKAKLALCNVRVHDA